MSEISEKQHICFNDPCMYPDADDCNRCEELYGECDGIEFYMGDNPISKAKRIEHIRSAIDTDGYSQADIGWIFDQLDAKTRELDAAVEILKEYGSDDHYLGDGRHEDWREAIAARAKEPAP